jgi:predicted AAA+ superfamily ATPase
LFLAPDHGVLARLRDAAATTLAWGSIVEDAREGRLTIDNLQQRQAEKELKSAQDVLYQTIRAGAASRDFFGTAYGQEGEAFEGFKLGDGDVVFDDRLVLIEPEAAEILPRDRQCRLGVERMRRA